MHAIHTLNLVTLGISISAIYKVIYYGNNTNSTTGECKSLVVALI